ncbi:MAG: VWA domain-containing protein [Hydrogenophaga sp.]|uniref:vWA domain-containing protein n=1 Tax=Hydrogenophaga sp. TaxID=1904254 RepID=UPI0025B9AB92|nr:VWA domain-containing protein [Hydrogenophaga sp.]MBT9551128.1 VWA domain-containing protein [Hydrogenophaga sp.]
MQLGDARTGKLADNITGFGRALRRAGVRVDSSRIALAADAALAVGLERKQDVSAAMEAVLVSREQDRLVFRELFDVYFRNPEIAQKLLSQLLPSAEGKAEPSQRRPRVREALSPQKTFGHQAQPKQEDQKVEFDAAMTASDLQRLKHADFNALSGTEYRLVERLARDIRLPLPSVASRRTRPGARGAQPHWPGMMRSAVRNGGELLELPRLERREQALPLLVLVDVSGSMERYTRLLLAFLHAATRQHRRRDVFAFGTRLTDLTPAFRLADTDEMLAHASQAIEDFAGGTQLGEALHTLRHDHARRLVGRRTLVLIVTDGLDTGEPQELGEALDWLRRRCRRLLWLNPLLRFDGYAPLARGAAELHSHAHGMLAVHNLSKLEDLASGLATLMKR